MRFLLTVGIALAGLSLGLPNVGKGQPGYYPTQNHHKPGFSEAMLSLVTEASQVRYHNLLLLPQEMVLAWGIGAYIPVLRSGDLYSLGAMVEAKYGISITLDRARMISVPVFLAARVGGGAQADTEHRIGGGVGIGLDMYRYMNTSQGPSFSELRPVMCAEVSWQRAWFRAFMRGGQMFTSRNMTRYYLSFGSEMAIHFKSASSSSRQVSRSQ